MINDHVYGMPTCPYCDYVHEQIKGRENEFEYINIGENIRNMSAFTRLRDTSHGVLGNGI